MGTACPGSAGVGAGQAEAASRGVLMPPCDAAGRARRGWPRVAWGAPALEALAQSSPRGHTTSEDVWQRDSEITGSADGPGQDGGCKMHANTVRGVLHSYEVTLGH